jgi:anti-sigma regulatory factor (Ser/Thr protein kinase)
MLDERRGTPLRGAVGRIRPYRRPVTTPPDDRPGEDLDHDAGLRASPPPSRFVLVRRWVLSSVHELHDLRAGLRTEIAARNHVRADQLLAGIADDLVLVATELASNALRYGRAPTIVELLQHDARLLLTVADHDLSTEPQIATRRPRGQGGFGLRITQHLSLDAAWYRTDRVKVVWAELGSS